ncbi:rho guanine nucleotide exchange factor 3-like [Antedon mediterranea]|uniref:rho guanine nucleotide exchange factor 3-like n=1 Tax=Antedon mediterranea TaxID=105859 RepID=UPI003AF521FB
MSKRTSLKPSSSRASLWSMSSRGSHSSLHGSPVTNNEKDVCPIPPPRKKKRAKEEKNRKDRLEYMKKRREEHYQWQQDIQKQQETQNTVEKKTKPAMKRKSLDSFKERSPSVHSMDLRDRKRKREDQPDICDSPSGANQQKKAKQEEGSSFFRYGSFSRKRSNRDDDNISVCSLNIKPSKSRWKRNEDGDNISICSLNMKESGTRRARSLVKGTSLVSLLSPVSSVKKVGHALQRSMSFRNTTPSPSVTIKPYSKPQATPTKRRDSRLWSETVQGNINEVMTKRQIKRQEAIFELLQGEQDMTDDLKLIMKTYRDSMRSLQMLNEQELNTIFGTLETLTPLHEELIDKLRLQRNQDGTTDVIGKIFLEWLPTVLDTYITYCSNQLAAKTLLDEKKQTKQVNDFLQRCRESPFSRKLDLWNFLDVPRSRLVKYPLLLKNILMLTPGDHEDRQSLVEAIKVAENMIKVVDRRTGETKCLHYINSFEYLEDKQRHPLINEQKVLLCGGLLKNNKGMKLHVFLFEEILVMTRMVTRNGNKVYQVHRQPIPVDQLDVEDLSDGTVKSSGSFRGAFTNNQTYKHTLRVHTLNGNGGGQSCSLQANDEHDKKQWLLQLRSAINSMENGNTTDMTMQSIV